MPRLPVTCFTQPRPQQEARFAPAFVASALALLLVAGCRPGTPAAPPASPPETVEDRWATGEDEFSVMTFNLLRYSMQDRDFDGQEDDFKPEEERRAVLDIIVAENPDVLAVQEMGRTNIFEGFRADLAARGLVYDFQEFLQRRDSSYNLGVLSRRPIVSYQSRLQDEYSIRDRTLYVGRGFIDVDISVNPAYTFKLIVAHLKSKRFHELGQTEMRRNEARLLNKHVRSVIREYPRMNVLVVGDLNDTYPSAAIREVVGEEPTVLHDLRPADYLGDVWTYFRRSHDQYSRIDYALVNEAMLPEAVPEKSRVVRRPEVKTASDHRPVVAVFKSRDLSPRQVGGSK